MTDLIQEKAINTIVAVNTAIRSIRLYPITSAATINAINKAYEIIEDILKQAKRLTFAESKNQLFIGGRPVSKAGEKAAHLSSFLELLLDFNINNLSMKDGLLHSEFQSFLEIISSNPNDIKGSGGLKNLVSEKNIVNIIINDTEQNFSAPKDETKKKLPEYDKYMDISNSFLPMLNTLANILETENKDIVLRHIAASVARKNEQFIIKILIQKIEGEFASLFFNLLMDEIEDEKFEKLIARMKYTADQIKAGNADNSYEIETIVHALRKMLRSSKGEQLQNRIKKKSKVEPEKVSEPSDSEKVKKAAHLRAGLDSILNEKNEAFKDPELMNFLPGAVVQLFNHNQNKAAEKFIDRLGEGLVSDDKDVRGYVSQVISSIINQLPSEQQFLVINRISQNLAQWLKLENNVGEYYEKISFHLMEMAKQMLLNGEIAESSHILDAFNYICTQKKSEKKECQIFIQDILKELTSGDILSLLMNEFRSDDSEKRKLAVHTLEKLGARATESLLKLLRENENRYERGRILKIITNIGPAAIPFLEKHIQKDEPWYYIRNIILLLGKVGNKSHIDILLPLLKYKDIRVRRECLNSIFAIDSKEGEDVILFFMSEAGDRFKIDMINILGNIKSRKAVPMLIEMLESDELMSSKAGENIYEHICTALGNIGSEKAVPVLQKIEKEGMLPADSREKSIRDAAANALKMIQKNK